VKKLVLLLMLLCCVPAWGQQKIRIAIAAPMTGSAAAFGHQIRLGSRLKIDQINAQGKQQFELVVMDDRGSPSKAIAVSRKLAADKTIPIVIGHFNSSCSIAAKAEYNRVGLVSLSPGSTHLDVCRGSKWTFRSLYNDRSQAVHLANYAKRLGFKRVALFYDNDDYGRGLARMFSAAAKKAGVAVISSQPYARERTQDFTGLVAPLKASKPDAVFVSGLYHEGALIAKATRKILPGVRLFGGDGMVAPHLIRTAGKSAEGFLALTPFLFDPENSSARAKMFHAAFKKAHGTTSDAWAALSYDAVGMAITAIREVGTNREKIRAWMASRTTPGKGYQGVTGNTWFDAEGDCLKPPFFIVVKGGQFRLAPKQLFSNEGK